MRTLSNSHGAALVTALMLTMLALVISMALLYSVTNATKTTASQKRYRTALAAAHGGVDLLTMEIIPRLLQSNSAQSSIVSDFSQLGMQLPQYACLQQKLSTPTAGWGGACTPVQGSADPSQLPDILFSLNGYQEASFSLSAKVVDSVPGNSDLSGNDQLDLGLGTSGRDEVIHPQHVPGVYSLAVQGVRDGGGQNEKARLSVLYAY